MIPLRIQRNVERITAQPREQIEKKARQFRHYSWFFLGMLILMVVNYIVVLFSGRPFVWNEAVAHTLPFLVLAGIMSQARDTLLLTLCMKDKTSFQQIPGA